MGMALTVEKRATDTEMKDCHGRPSCKGCSRAGQSKARMNETKLQQISLASDPLFSIKPEGSPQAAFM